MRIVHVEEFFHPDAGYQVNMLSRLQAAAGHQVTVIAAEFEKMPSHLTAFFGEDQIESKDAEFERTTGVTIRRLPLLGFYSGRAIFFPSVFSAVSARRPDVVFVHGLETLTGILFIALSKRLGYPIVLDSHMLEMATRNRFSSLFTWFFRHFITPKILREKIPIIRVVDSNYVQKCLGIPLDRTELGSFGTDTAHFQPDAGARRSDRERLGLDQNAFVVIYAGKLDDNKGGAFLAKAIEKKIETAKSRQPIEFLIVGNSDGAYGRSVEQTLLKCESKLVRLPTQRYFDLAGLYQAADIAVYPRQCSLSFFEAQSCGLPVLFEENEINTQRASHGGAMTFIPGNVVDFRNKLAELADLPSAEFNALQANARNFVLKNYNYVPVAAHFNTVLQHAADSWRQPRQGEI